MPAALTKDPRADDSTYDSYRPRLFPDELRTKPQLEVHQAEHVWTRCIPANQHRALAEIAEKVFTKADRAEIQKLEDAIGKVDADRKEHCSAEKFDQAAWDLAQDINLLPDQYAK